MTDLRIKYNEEMVGADHPSKADTINRLALSEHDSEGAHTKLTKVTDPYVDIRAFGAACDGVTDDTVAWNDAINSLSNGGVIEMPQGVTSLIGGSITAGADYLENLLIVLKSNITIRGNGSTIKLKDHLLDGTTDETSNAHMMGSASAISNVLIEEVVFDCNGANNLTPSGKTRNAHAIWAKSGGSNFTIKNCTFKNCAGRNVIGIKVGAGAGKDLFIVNNVLENGGRYVGTATENQYNTDFSFIYAEWENSKVNGNIIRQGDRDIALHGYSGGVELHGSNSEAKDNTIIHCDPAVWIASAPAAIENMEVSGNTIKDSLRGVAFWIGYAMKNVTIVNNRISLNRSSLRASEYAVGIQQPHGSYATYDYNNGNAAYVENLTVTGNVITSNLATGTYVSRGLEFHSIYKGRITGNIVENMTEIGFMVYGSPWGMTDVEITGNQFMNNGRGATLLANRTGIYFNFSGASTTPAKSYFINNVTVEDNHFGNTHIETYDNADNVVGNSCAGTQSTGITVAGLSTSVVRNLNIRDNRFKNIIYNIYGGTTPQLLETQNPEAHFIPEVIVSQANPLTDRKLFGSETIVYATTGARQICSLLGVVTTKTGTASASASSYDVTVDDSNRMRVGWFLLIPGAGAAGGSYYGYIKSIADNVLTMDTQISTTVAGAAYTVIAPTLTYVNHTNNLATALMTSGVTLNNGAGAGAGTLTNAPAAGNPTKWIPINDNGTTRYIPAW